MTPEQAVTAIRDMTFRPGWTLHAERQDARHVYVWAEVETTDTSYPTPEGAFKREIVLAPDAEIDVSGLNLDGLCFAILEQLVAPHDEHENREFLQVRTAAGRWYAPLHPHTADGQRSWLRHIGSVISQVRATLAGAA